MESMKKSELVALRKRIHNDKTKEQRMIEKEYGVSEMKMIHECIQKYCN